MCNIIYTNNVNLKKKKERKEKKENRVETFLLPFLARREII